MLARGSLGNPWLFGELLGTRAGEPGADEVLDELDWVMERAVEHLGERRAVGFLRKFYPWYLVRLGAPQGVKEALNEAETVEAAGDVLRSLRTPVAA